MSGLDRFTAFLRRTAASYNEPPEVPADAVWRGVEEDLADSTAASSSATGVLCAAGAPADADVANDAPIHTPGYHAAPPPPRDEMWERIEASWALRRAAASGVASAVAAPRWQRIWNGRPGGTRWVAALAAAASLVLGIALGRGTRTGQPGESTVPTAASPPSAAAPEAATPAATVAELQSEDTDDPGTSAAEVVSDGAVAMAASVDVPGGAEAETRYLVAVNAPAERAVTRPHRYEPERDYLTAEHLGRAATLLTAFRTDRRTPASEQDLAQWARELLVDTRMFLGLSDFSSPIEQVLLEDLELVLIQIAGLGPGAPDFEWALARESMERRGTLMRLRAVGAEGKT